MDILTAQKIHCIGIGGIGVSALASFWRAQGKEVSGSDAEASEITKALEKQGIQVKIQGKPPLNLPLAKGEKEGVDLVVYSDAISEDHPERIAARTRGIPELSYAQALGEVSREYRTIVVTGTHGKSTTTALLGLMLEAAGMDPLVIVGTRVPQWANSNLRLPTTPNPSSERRGNDPISSPARGEDRRGGSDWLVVEGDDYRDHFLELQPHAVVITSIEWDHPDYFRDLEHTVESFAKLADKVPEGGRIVINKDDAGCQLLRSAIPRNRRMVMYGQVSEVFSHLQLQVPGEFNRYNATAAATAAMELGVPSEIVEQVAREFRGVWRRFEVVEELDYANGQSPANNANIRAISGEAFARSQITIISDYAHHPTAIRETMKAARQAYPGRRLVLVYQPHQHSRTKHLFDDFVEVLKDAAELTIVSDIYAVKGRMEDWDVSSQMLVDRIARMPSAANNANVVLYGGDLKGTKRVVLENVQSGDVVIFMGAGDIDSLARQLVKDDTNGLRPANDTNIRAIRGA